MVTVLVTIMMISTAAQAADRDMGTSGTTFVMSVQLCRILVLPFRSVARDDYRHAAGRIAGDRVHCGGVYLLCADKVCGA
jgi:hypothetical protein